MADGVTEITTRRGYDIRDFSLLACGGGGALCGAFMAELLKTKNVLIPEFAASFCAWSMFCLDVGRDYIRTYIGKIGTADTAAINRLYEEMVDEALAEFKALNVTRDEMTIVKSVDARYPGQFHEIEMKLPEGEITRAHLEELRQDFHDKHKELFTFSLPEDDVEIRSLRIIAAVKSKSIELPEFARHANGSKSLKRKRQCFFNGRFMDTPIHDANLVGAGETIKGHAIVETPTTTIVIPPGFTCSLDKYGTYILKKED
jgi:N-methylhydantoinase A